MSRFIVGLLLAATLSGCAAPTPEPIQSFGSSRSSLGITEAELPRCLVDPERVTRSGEVIPASYRCLTSEPVLGVPVGVCTSVAGYYLKDGTYLPIHQRCQLSAFRAYIAEVRQRSYDSDSSASSTGSASGSGNAPCVTSVCGPVSVRGYTRKDGTYVRPHTRSRARK